MHPGEWFPHVEIKFLIYFLCICLMDFISISYYPSEPEPGAKNLILSKVRQRRPVILMWTNYYEVKGDTLLKLIFRGKEFDRSCCDGVNITLDRGQLERADAIVIFHYFWNLNLKDLPKTRRPDQLWILFGKESPYLAPPLGAFNNLFNWTMSYRKDSDIFAPYGELVRVKEKKVIDVNGVPLDTFIGRKEGLIAGVISNCVTPGRRENFVSELRQVKNLTFQLYGWCGKYICQRNNPKCNHTRWWKGVGDKYKFYFAAENSICTDYITEKFWRALQLGMVPVAYGGANYSQFAPPHSYIDVRDFKTVKDVGEYLKKLDKDKKEYRKYFEWRKKYEVRMGEGWQGWCELCRKVKKFREELEERGTHLTHGIKDLWRWWAFKKGNKQRACDSPPFKYNVTKPKAAKPKGNIKRSNLTHKPSANKSIAKLLRLKKANSTKGSPKLQNSVKITPPKAKSLKKANSINVLPSKKKSKKTNSTKRPTKLQNLTKMPSSKTKSFKKTNSKIQ